MIADLHFLRPLWLLAIPLGWLLIWHSARLAAAHAGAWLAVIDPALRPHVLVSATEARTARWPWMLAAVSVLAGGVSLAGPAWERQKVPVTRSGDAMVIVLDLSRSMDATDVAPSRLARARLKLKDILRARAGGDTGLVVFSANAFVVTPLTDDTDTIDAMVPTLVSSLMPSRGSYPESGLFKAAQLLEQSDVAQGRILLITDGGNMPPAIDAARELNASGHEVSVLAVGTTDGGPIPQQNGGFVADDRGNIAVPKLDRGPLRRLARAGGGRFAELTSNDADLLALELAARADVGVRVNDDEQSIERWVDMGPWLLLLLLPLAALTFRRGGFAVVACLLILPVGKAHALSWQDLWQTRDQQARDALEAGEAERAAKLFDDPGWKAAAEYRGGNYAQSADGFAQLDDTTATYNAGNALALSGDIGNAIKAYEDVLAADPAHEDARFNLELLRSLQGDSQQSQGEGGEDTSQEGEQSDKGESQSGEQSGDSAGQSANPSDAGEQANARESNATDEAQQQRDIEALQQAMRDAEAAGNPVPEEMREQLAELRSEAEQQQALEQWLRLVPDDPGGLLRRKFRYQYQRRQTDQDGNRLWPDDRAEPW
ncbi:MAG: VWA domain-containing protein [Pseudomonadota bacterium]